MSESAHELVVRLREAWGVYTQAAMRCAELVHQLTALVPHTRRTSMGKLGELVEAGLNDDEIVLATWAEDAARAEQTEAELRKATELLTIMGVDVPDYEAARRRLAEAGAWPWPVEEGDAP